MTTLPELIRSVTNNCPRADCSLYEAGGVTTLLGWSACYDKNGNRIKGGDPNVHKSSLICSACLRQWLMRTQGGQTTISEKINTDDRDARHQPTV
jgi:hypothetical protein